MQIKDLFRLSLQNLQGIMGASSEDLALCPGFGPQKVSTLLCPVFMSLPCIANTVPNHRPFTEKDHFQSDFQVYPGSVTCTLCWSSVNRMSSR